MGWQRRIRGPRETRSPKQQIADTLEFLRTGRDPRTRRAGEEGYRQGKEKGFDDGFEAGYEVGRAGPGDPGYMGPGDDAGGVGPGDDAGRGEVVIEERGGWLRRFHRR